MAKLKISKYINLLAKILTASLSLIQLFDFMFASIEAQDFLGTGRVFMDVPEESYQVANGLSSLGGSKMIQGAKNNFKKAVSKYGYKMLLDMGKGSKDYNWGKVGSFDPTQAPEMNMCNKFKDTFTNVPAQNARLMSIREKLSFIRPMSMGDSVSATWSEATLSLDVIQQMQDDGYIGARRALDVYLTDRVDVQVLGEGTFLSLKTRVIRYYGKTFCDGCEPMAELGNFDCNLKINVSINDDNTTYTVKIGEGKNIANSLYDLGLAFHNSSITVFELVFRFILFAWILYTSIFILTDAIKSTETRFFLSKKEGGDADSLSSGNIVRSYLYELLLPENYSCSVQPFSISFLMYNSDLIVFIQMILVILALLPSMALQREIIWWSTFDPTFRSFITRVSINLRIMWIYFGLFKLSKALFLKLGFIKFASQMIYHGYYFIFGYAISLFTLDQMLDIFYSDRVDATNDPLLVSNINVHVFDGFYVHRIPGFLIHTLLGLFLNTLFFMILQKVLRVSKNTANNSLYQLFTTAHTIIIWDDLIFDEMDQSAKNYLKTSVGTAMNLKWFLGYHLFSFHVSLESLFRKSTEHSSEKYENRSVQPKDTELDENVCSCVINREGKINYRMKTNTGTMKPIEHTLIFYKWLNQNSKFTIA